MKVSESLETQDVTKKETVYNEYTPGFIHSLPRLVSPPPLSFSN